MTSVKFRSVILEFPSEESPVRAALISVFDAETGDQIYTIRDLHLYANAEGLVMAEAAHIPEPWPDGTERTERYMLAGVRMRAPVPPDPVFESDSGWREPRQWEYPVG